MLICQNYIVLNPYEAISKYQTNTFNLNLSGIYTH